MRGKLWLGVAVSAVLLWVAVRGVSLEEVLHQLRQVRPIWLVPVLGSIFVRFWLTAIRWQFLLPPVKQIGVHRLFAITMIGFMANNVLPARLGEFVRAYALGRSETLPASLPFATIVIERIFDGFTLLMFLVGGLSFLRPSRTLLWAAGLTCGLYLGVLVGLMVLRTGRGLGLLTGALDRLPARLADPARRLLESFRGRARRPQQRARPRAHGHVVARDLARQRGRRRGDLLRLRTGSAALRVLPRARNHRGRPRAAVGARLHRPLPGGTVEGLALVGVPRETALSLSIVYHLANYVPITLGGLAYLSALNLTLGDLRSAGEKSA